MLGAVVLVSIPLLIYRYLKVKPGSARGEIGTGSLILSPVLGLVLGALMGATGVTGSITLIAFLLILKLPSPVAVGTTSFVGAVALLVASIAHISAGHVNWLAFAALVPGVMIGAFAGAHFVSRVPRNLLRYSVLGILAVAGILIFL